MQLAGPGWDASNPTMASCGGDTGYDRGDVAGMARGRGFSTYEEEGSTMSGSCLLAYPEIEMMLRQDKWFKVKVTRENKKPRVQRRWRSGCGTLPVGIFSSG